MQPEGKKNVRRGRPRSTSLPFVPFDPHLERNPKIRRARRILAPHAPDPETCVWYIARLWMHCGQCAVDGVLGALDAEDLADLVGWPGDPEIFLLAVNSAQLVVHDEHGVLRVHDWAEYGGKCHAQRERWREQNAAKSRKSDFTRSKLAAGLPKGKGKGKRKDLPPTPPPAEVQKTAPAEELPPPVVCGVSGFDLSDSKTYPDDRLLSVSEQEALLSRPQMGVAALWGVGAGATLGAGPVHVWELRAALRAVSENGQVGKPKSYIFSVIRRGRDAGWSNVSSKRYPSSGILDATREMLQSVNPSHVPFERDKYEYPDASKFGEEALAAMAWTPQ